MSKIKQNMFWVGVGVATAILVAGFVILVLPQYADRSKYQGEITKSLKSIKPDNVPSTKDLDQWKAYRAGLINNYEEIKRFYADADQNLERWLGGLQDPVARGQFMQAYSDAIAKIEDDLKAKGVQVEDPEGEARFKGGFLWEVPAAADFDRIGLNEEPAVLKQIQKRFWARQRVADVILKGGFKVTRVYDFRFPRRLHEKIQSAPWENQQRPAGSVVKYAFEDSSGKFVEKESAGGLAKTVTFGFAVILPYSGVPKFIREFLNPSDANARERLLINILHSHVTIQEQNEAEYEYEYKYRDKKDKEEKEAELAKRATVKDVILVVTAQLVDFDATKAKTFGDGAASASGSDGK